MRRLRLCALMMILLLLSGCAGETLDSVTEDLTQQYHAAVGIDALATVTAFYSDHSAEFALRYQDSAGAVSVTVEEPESLRGITASPTEDLLTLSFDGAVLAAGDFDDLRLSPMALIPLMMQQLRESFPASFLSSKERITLYYPALLNTRDAEFEITFDKNTYAPLQCDLYLEGTKILAAEFQQFSCG